MRIFFILSIVFSLTLQADASPFQSSKKVKIIAAACAALLVGNHTSRVVEYVGDDDPAHPAKHYDLPVGAGGIRESLENLLARATKKNIAKTPTNQKFLLPSPNFQYEYTIKLHLDKLTKDEVNNFVSFVSRNDKYMTGYLSHSGVYGQFIASRVSEHESFYEIYSLDGRERISQGYLRD